MAFPPHRRPRLLHFPPSLFIACITAVSLGVTLACCGASSSPPATPTPPPTATPPPAAPTATPIVPAASNTLLDAVLQPEQAPSGFRAMSSATGPRPIANEPDLLKPGLKGMFTSAYQKAGTTQIIVLYDYALKYTTAKAAHNAFAQFRFLIQSQGGQLLPSIRGIGDETAAWHATSGQNIPTTYVAWSSGDIFSYVFSLGPAALPDNTMAALARKAEANIKAR